MNVVDIFTVLGNVALLYCVLYLMDLGYEKDKIVTEDRGQRYEYRIYIPGRELKGYSSRRITRNEDIVYYCDFVRITDMRFLCQGPRTRDAVDILRKDLKTIRCETIDRSSSDEA